MRLLTLIVGWSLGNRPVIIAAAMLLTLLGWRAAVRLHLDATPDLTPVQVQVVTSATALSPLEIEQYVTLPVERALASTPRSTEIRSLSKYGFSMVTVTFEDDTDVLRARQLISERLAQAQIPPRYGRPQLAPSSSALGEVYQFVVENDGLTAMQKRELVDWYIGPQVRTVPGVVDLCSLGGEEREYHLLLEPGRLAAAGVSIAEVAAAVERANGNVGGGYIERSREQIIIGTEGQLRSLDDFRRIVVAAGLRSDVAVLIYGDDLTQLGVYGSEIARIVRSVRGAQDVRVEQVAGLKYLRIVPDRQKLARYGLSVSDVNEAAETIAAGRPVGVVFEHDRRFNAVLKLKNEDGADLHRLAALPLKAPSGLLVPLGEVAALRVEEGPAEINRALAGVAILNGLVLVSAAQKLQGQGKAPAQAIYEAAHGRLRPVLMTALVAALGFVPMALSTAPGSEVQRPLATVIIGGVLSAALLTLIVLPVL